ncbi:hypothetical protein [Sphingopyxis indica]|uniref:hypothetical protein n=1 Tax=Sphingopyxis indica TaxID=436663 RepID=UPI000B784B53|nr:hypothetical protein [Sphingopyxis indica]
MHLDVGLAEHGEQITRAGAGEVGHVEIGVDPRLQHGQRPHAVELRCMRVEVERRGDQQVETRLHRLARGGGQVGARDGAIFGADEDCGAARWRAWGCRRGRCA